ncbi:hypothetical protein GRAN_2633 [Granulicella sibirica]|uniref:Uncharacterized protein n=2 Tax=Granulicella sibirica TaxID=2479048 RepID=A0A4Q0T2Q6_9BACT|nr:hypothetical protein GRAN_2633 [Granulicella sibirica]
MDGFEVRGGRVQVVYASGEPELKALKEEIGRWEGSIGNDPSPPQQDSLELARYAVRRWGEAYKQKPQKGTAHTMERLKQMIVNNPRSDVRMLALAQVGWLQGEKTVGVCMFRRTWCNNIALEVVAAHPGLDEKKESPISGLGTGFLHHVSSVAETISASAIWGECTQNSAEFYKVFVDQPEHLKDLIILPKEQYQEIRLSIETIWKGRDTAPNDGRDI